MHTIRTLAQAGAVLAAAAVVAACGSPVTQEAFPKEAKTDVANLYELKAPALDGGVVSLSDFRGKAVLVVNVASECGFTGQYEGLQKLHDEYAAKGFAVLGFPSNEFGGQEPGTAAEIRKFCTSKFDVEFPMFAKVEVKKGAGQSPVYAYLTTATGKEPNWNFCKYVVDRKGVVTAFFPSRSGPDDKALRASIDAALAAN